MVTVAKFCDEKLRGPESAPSKPIFGCIISSSGIVGGKKKSFLLSSCAGDVAVLVLLSGTSPYSDGGVGLPFAEFIFIYCTSDIRCMIFGVSTKT